MGSSKLVDNKDQFGTGPWLVFNITSHYLKSRVSDHILSRWSRTLERVNVGFQGPTLVMRCCLDNLSAGWADSIVSDIASDSRLVLCIESLLVCDKIAESFEELLQNRELLSSEHSFRILTSPKRLCAQIGTRLPEEIMLHPKNFDRVIYAFELCPNLIFYSTTYGRGSYYAGFPLPRARKAMPTPASRAYFKMMEVAAILGAGCFDDEMVGIDIGAAPGGWTECLSDRIRYVLAIDPGEIHPRILSRPNVKHVQKRVENSHDDVDRMLSTYGRSQLDVCVCDMNRPPAVTLACIMEMVPKMRPGCVLVVTLKFVHGKRAQGRRCETGAFIESLKSHFEDFRNEWLFTNQMLERTIIARRKEVNH